VNCLGSLFILTFYTLKMRTITGKLLSIILVIFGVYLLLESKLVSDNIAAFHGSHLEEIALGFLGGLITIFLLNRNPQRKVGK